MDFLLLSLIKAAVIAFVLLTTLAYLQWIERKVIGHIQLRVGPYRVGPHGLLQPLADVVKLITKEGVLPSHVNKFFYLLAPFLINLRLRTIFAIIAAAFAARFSWYAMGHDVDPWTYRFFPFEIGLFVLGIAAYRISKIVAWWPSQKAVVCDLRPRRWFDPGIRPAGPL